MGQASSTAFVGIDHRPAAQSFHPCHKFGEGDLFGLGIRLAWYLQYAIIILAYPWGVRRSIRNVQVGLAVLALGMFIALIVVSTGEGLIFLNWYIVTALAMAYGVLSNILTGPAWWVYLQGTVRRGIRELDEEIEKLDNQRSVVSEQRRDAVSRLALASYTRREAERRRAEAEETHEQIHGNAFQQSFNDLRLSLVTYNPIGQFFHVQNIRNIIESYENFNDSEFQAIIRDSELQFREGTREAEEFRHMLDQITKLERDRLILRRAWKDILKEENPQGFFDRVLVGIMYLIWCLYLFCQPFLYWNALYRGWKTGCDVTVGWAFATMSLSNNGFVIWLKITSITNVLFGVIALGLAGIFLYIGLFVVNGSSQYRRLYDPRDTESTSSGSSSSSDRPLRARLESLDGEDDEEDEELILQRRQARKVTKILRLGFHLGYALAQLVALAFTIAAVEITIHSNRLDMSRSTFTSTGQFVAFIIGLLTTIPVLWELFFILPRRRHLRHKAERAADRHRAAKKKAVEEKGQVTYDPIATVPEAASP
jgi:hypothetical protein